MNALDARIKAKARTERAREALLDVATELASLAGTASPIEITHQLRCATVHNYAVILSRLYSANDDYQDALSMECGVVGVDCDDCGGSAMTGHFPGCRPLRSES